MFLTVRGQRTRCLRELEKINALTAPERNARKLNSHRWFFSAFAPQLKPNVCILLDVGTKPGPRSLYALWKAFDLNSNVAGACGEIVTMKGRFWTSLLNPLVRRPSAVPRLTPQVAAQNFEYKVRLHRSSLAALQFRRLSRYRDPELTT